MRETAIKYVTYRIELNDRMPMLKLIAMDDEQQLKRKLLLRIFNNKNN